MERLTPEEFREKFVNRTGSKSANDWRKEKNANALTESILSYLRMCQVEAWRQNNTAVYDPKIKQYRSFQGRRGVSDIIGIHKPSGAFVAVEVKVGKDKLSEEQRDFLNLVGVESGGFAVEARSLDDVVEAFGRWKEGRL